MAFSHARYCASPSPKTQWKHRTREADSDESGDAAPEVASETLNVP